MSTTIESLELEVQSSATSATSGIDALSASLSRLKNAVKGGVGLTSVANQLRNLNTALQTMDSSSADKIDRLANSLSKLSGLGSIKISASIGNQLRNIGSAVSSLGTTDFSGLSRLSTALAPLNSLSRASGLQSAITQLNKLPQLAQTLNGIDWDTFTQQIQRLSTALTPLANQLNTVSIAFSRLPTNIRGTIAATDALSKSNDKASGSYVNLWAKCRMAMNAVRGISRIIAGWINNANDFIETTNLFTVSLGEYAEAAYDYAKQVNEKMGIDIEQWMQFVGSLNVLIEGFGVASDKAYLMSKNLTQLTYDLASLKNSRFEDAFLKIQSGIAGELEPLRAWGFDLSVARLQQEALNLGITKSVSAMTQAEKSQLRYYAIMTQVTVAQGDMARTITAPANQLRLLNAQLTQCARTLGNLFIPMLNAVLPPLIAMVKVLTAVINIFAKLFGLPELGVDFDGLTSGVGGFADSAGDAEDALNGAAKAAKKLKNAVLGIDELNIIAPNDNAGGGAGSGLGIGGGDLGIELPEYNFLDGLVNTQLDEIVRKMKEWLGIADGIDSWSELFESRLGRILKLVATVGATLATWKIAKGVIAFIDKLSKMGGGSGGKFGWLLLLADSMSHLIDCVQDILENGANFNNVTGVISEFASGLGAAMIALGQVKIGGALIAISGVMDIVRAVQHMTEVGVNWDDALTAVRGISKLVIAIGALSGNTLALGSGFTLIGVTTAIEELRKAQDEAGNIQWDKVDWVTFGVGAAEAIFGIIKVVGYFRKAKETLDTGTSVAEAAQTLTQTTQSMSDSADTMTTSTGQLSPKLKSLAKNIGMGVLILGEVAAGAIIFAGAIAVLGVELDKVGKAWQPVLANAGTVATAVGVGTGLLVGVGAACYLLGTGGKTIALNVGIGAAILVELGVATGLFIAEIWAIGKGLNEVNKAWQPVLKNGKPIATAIGVGTGLLVGVGVVCAALGAATVASAGLLPLAIGLGTALLVELAAACVALVKSITAVGKSLNNDLYPEVTKLNGKLPSLKTAMSNFTNYMGEFAGCAVSFSKDTAIAGLAGAASSIVTFFTGDPIQKIADKVKNVADSSAPLKEDLDSAVSNLKSAKDKLTNLQNLMNDLCDLTNSSKSVGNLSMKSKITCTVDVKLEKSGWKTVKDFVGKPPKIEQEISLKKSGWQSVKSWIGNLPAISQDIALRKSGWTTVKNWIGTLPVISQGISLVKSGWTTVAKWIGTPSAISQAISLSKSGWTSVSSWVENNAGGATSQDVSLNKSGWSTVTAWVKKNLGSGSVSIDVKLKSSGGTVSGFSSGGIITRNSFWNAIPKYAGGTNRPHGSMFIAGENGAEMVGHVNGTTEVLNRFQLASVMHSSIVAGMSQFVGYWRMMNSQMVTCTNAIIRAVLATPDMTQYAFAGVTSYDPTNALAQSVYEDSSQAYNHMATSSDFEGAMNNALETYYRNHVASMAEDIRKQADKEEQTIVQVGDRTITDAVERQQKANGFKFA